MKRIGKFLVLLGVVGMLTATSAFAGGAYGFSFSYSSGPRSHHYPRYHSGVVFHAPVYYYAPPVVIYRYYAPPPYYYYHGGSYYHCR